MEIIILIIIVLAVSLALLAPVYVYNYDNKIDEWMGLIESDNLIISGQKELISMLIKENEELKKIK